MDKKYLMVEIDDSRINGLAEVLSNKTSRKILEFLSENEVSETEIVNKLGIKASTVNYNIKKLLYVGLIEKSKNYAWSVKGKKIPFYKVSNKKIVISPKSSKGVKSLVAALGLTGVLALVVKGLQNNLYMAYDSGLSKGMEYAESSGIAVSPDMVGSDKIISGISQGMNVPQLWIWFLLGGIVALTIFMILNWRKL